MKLFVTSVLLLATLSFGDNETDETIKCEKLGCNYDPHDDISKLITCKPNGIQLSVNFKGNNTCNDWRDFEGIVSKSSPNNPCCSKESSNQSTPEPLIVGGHTVLAKDYPFITWFSSSWTKGVDAFCGGSILRKAYPSLILTAAHCVVDPEIGWLEVGPTANTYVLLNANKRHDDGSNVIKSKVYNYLKHPQYKSNGNGNYDVAVLILYEDLSKYPELKQVTINPTSTGSDCCVNNDWLTVIGYGADCQTCENTPTLEAVDINYVDRTTCKQTARQTITDNMICGSSTNGRDSCYGDSGGPLIKIGTMEQVGLVSESQLGAECADGTPVIYTNTYSSSIYTFIQNIKNYKSINHESSCYFPFEYNGNMYYQCTTDGRSDGYAWCSEDAIYEYDSKWHICH